MVYILIAILIFGVLIAVHEFGHFLAAKAAACASMNFPSAWARSSSIRRRGTPEYSLRLLPIGGYCAMEGEDEDSDDDARWAARSGGRSSSSSSRARS